MKFQTWLGAAETVASDCIIVGIFEKARLSPTAAHIDKACGGRLTRLLKQGEIDGKLGSTLMLHHLSGIQAERVLLVGCGDKETLSLINFRKIIETSFKAVASTAVATLHTTLTELPVTACDETQRIRHIIEVIEAGRYRFEHYRSAKKPTATLANVFCLLSNKKLLAAAQKAIATGAAIAAGARFAKDLANHPASVCTPTWMAAQAKTLGKAHNEIKVKVLDEAAMRKLGMNALLAVAQGSANPPKLVCVEYHGDKGAPIVFLGKGVTFDTGGLSLKSGEGMVGMKYDMCGAATALGVIKAAAELKLPLHLVAILALAENMPSGTAFRPEDIITSLSGQTIEVLNTDAEGRLVLCDALTYAERYKPEAVIDIATLTGAVVIALGHQASAVMSNQQALADALVSAGEKSADRVWQLPLFEEYQEQLKSPFADMSNVGGRSAGAITAGCFLARFTKKYHWAHLDVAGTAAMMMGGSERYATGRPVPVLMQFLLDKLNKK